jgi:hypothetical protein
MPIENPDADVVARVVRAGFSGRSALLRAFFALGGAKGGKTRGTAFEVMCGAG